MFCLPPAAQGLPKGKDVLGRVSKSYRSAKSYRVQAVVTTQVAGAPQAGVPMPGPPRDLIDIAFRAPNLVRIERGTTMRSVEVLGAGRGPGQFQPNWDPPRNTTETVDSLPASSQPDPENQAQRQRVQWMKNAGFMDYSAIEDGLTRAETLRQEKVDFEGSPVACWVVEASYAAGNRRTLWVDPARNVVLREVEISPVKMSSQPVEIEHTITVQHLAWNIPLDDLFANPPPVASVPPAFAPPGPNGVTPPTERNGCHDAGYTEEAHIAHLTGTVMVDFTIDPQGKPVNVKALNHLGLGLDELAIGCVEESTYQPAQRDGQAMAVRSRRTVSFQIREPVSSEWHLGEVVFHPQTGDSRPVFLKAPYPPPPAP